MAPREMHEALVRRLTAVRRRKNLAGLLQGAATSLLLFLGCVLALLLLEDTLYLGTIARTVIFALTLAGGAALLATRVAPFLGRLFLILPDDDDEVTAREVGRAYPGIHDRLQNALQLIREKETGTIASRGLIDAALDDLHRQIDGVDFGAIVDFAGPRRRARWTAGVAGGAVLLFILFPTSFFGAAHRLTHFGEAFAAPAPFQFVVEPGNAELVRGEDVRILVRVLGEPQSGATLLLEPQGNPFPQELALRATPEGTFRHELRSVNTATGYFVRARGVESEHYMLSVIDRPVVKNLRVRLAPPLYAGIPASELEDNAGDITALKGTRARFSVEANGALGSGTLVMSDSSQIPLEVTGKHGAGALTIMKEQTYHVILRDSAGRESVNPVEYAIRILPDAFPAVSIVSPGSNLDITDNTSLPLLIKITDDFGFSKLRLAYKLVQSRYEQAAEEFTYVSIPLPPRPGTEALVPFPWTLKGLRLVPEDVLTYAVEVFDNDNVSGPKSALSEFFSLRLPSLDEVFADADKTQESGIEKMTEALKQAGEARKGLEELQQDMKKSKDKLEWREKNRTEELVKKYDEVTKAMDEVSATMNQLTADLQKNKLLSKETLQKYQELQEMMAQLASPEFAEALKKLQQAMQQVSPEAMKQAMQQFSFSEDDFRHGIERTLNLLKRIQIEQKLDEAIRRAEEMARAENELAKKTGETESTDRKTLSELAREQKAVGDQLHALQRETGELSKKMEELSPEMPVADMEESMKEMNDKGLEEDVNESSRQLERQQPAAAAGPQQRAARVMERTAASLKKLQQTMQQNQQRQVLNRMRKAMEDLLDISRREEELKNETQGLDQNSPRFRENAQGQMDAMRDLAAVTEGLSTLSQKTFSVTPEMGRSIGKALRGMNEAMQSLNQRDRAAAAQQQEGAMGSMNEAALQMQAAMEAMRQGGGQGGGMAGLMQRLQRMSGQQQGINDGTKNMGGMTPEQAAAMGRLAAEQGAVRKSLEQLAREATASGELSKMLGDLNRIAQEMREVQTDLAGGNVDPETLRKQDRILSRLLDAQRSARERDFEKERKAATGTNTLRPSPGTIDLTTQEGRSRLRRDLQKAMEEGYAREYEELIRRYFEVLEQYENRSK